MYTDKKELEEHFKDHGWEGEVGNVLGCMLQVQTEQDTHLYLFLPKRYSVGTTYHEALHLVHYILEHHSITIDSSDSCSELQAYMQESIVRVIKREVYGRKK